MIVKRQRNFSNSSRFWAGTKEAAKGGAKGALIGAALIPGKIIAAKHGNWKTAAGIAGVGALAGGYLGTKTGWRAGIGQWESDQVASDPNTKSKIENMLPKDYQKFVKLEKEIGKLNRAYEKSCKAEEPAILVFDSFDFDNDDNNIITKWLEIDKKYRDSLVPICHFVGYYYDDIDHTDIYYNPKEKKYYIGYFAQLFSSAAPKQIDPKKSLLGLLEYIKRGVEVTWEDLRKEEDVVILNPKDWERDYYIPCKKLISSIL